MTSLLPERTIPYKTWVKTSLVEALRQVFVNHLDDKLRKTKVSIDFPTSELQYPSIVIRFYERSIHNAGVGHVEYLYVRQGKYTAVVKNEGLVIKVQSLNDDELTTQVQAWRNQGYSVKVYDQYRSINKFRHYLYNGDIEFAIFALSSLDRDLISDTVIQTLAMPDMAGYTKDFFKRIYFPTPRTPLESGDYEPGEYNYVNLNTDDISGFGETQTPQPWLSEDQLVYQTSYRVGITGEFYSLPPINTQPAFNLIEHVNFYPYLSAVGESIPSGVTDPSLWDDAVSFDGDVVRTYDPTQWH